MVLLFLNVINWVINYENICLCSFQHCTCNSRVQTKEPSTSHSPLDSKLHKHLCLPCPCIKLFSHIQPSFSIATDTSQVLFFITSP